MGDTIRLESDWGLWPILLRLQDERGFGTSSYDYLVETYDVPDFVIQAIRAWDARYQALYNREDPRESGDFTPEQWDAYHEAGRAAARLLRRHLPADVVIEYAGADSIPSEFY